jgi:ATP/ADP translocase
VPGCALQVFGRAAKYSLFDPSKEMVFITMSKEEKEAGKAAVDVLGNQIGKTGGSWLMQVRRSLEAGTSRDAYAADGMKSIARPAV